MTPADFRLSLDALSDLVASAGSPSQGNDLRYIATIFGASKEKTAAATLKRLSTLHAEATATNENLGRLASLLEVCANFMSKASVAKYAKLLNTLASILNNNSNASPPVFVQAAITNLQLAGDRSVVQPRENIVGGYVKRLEDALGDESFASVHRQLSGDRNVTAAEVVAIAKTFSGKKPSGREKALQAIWSRQHTLMTFRSKSESRAGRSAA